MKSYIKLVFVLSIVYTSCNQNHKKTTDDTKDFKAVEQVVQNAFDDIWSEHKAERISKYHTNDFIILEHGELWTNDTIANWCKRAKLRNAGVKRINSFDFFKAKKEGNRIWMAYHNYATIKMDTIEAKYQWLESIVAIKQDSIWKLEMMHSTRVKTN